MARIRTVKPELFQSYTIKRLSLEARWTFVGLLTHVDDDGYCRDEPRIIKGAVWPLEDDVTWADVAKHIEELLHAGLVCRFHHNGVPHLHVVTFREHQVINRATKSRLPHCPEHTGTDLSGGTKSKHGTTAQTPLTEPSVNPPAQVTEGSWTAGKGSGKEVERELEGELKAAAAAREPGTEQADAPPATTQPAAAAAATRTRTPPPEAAPLVDALAAKGFVVGWNLRPDQWALVAAAIDRSGTDALIDHAVRCHKPHDPAKYATAWLDGWSSLPPLTQDSPLHPTLAAAPPAPLTPRQQRRERNLAVLHEAAALEGIDLGTAPPLGIAS